MSVLQPDLCTVVCCPTSRSLSLSRQSFSPRHANSCCYHCLFALAVRGKQRVTDVECTGTFVLISKLKMIKLFIAQVSLLLNRFHIKKRRQKVIVILWQRLCWLSMKSGSATLFKAHEKNQAKTTFVAFSAVSSLFCIWWRSKICLSSKQVLLYIQSMKIEKIIVAFLLLDIYIYTATFYTF